MCLIPDHPDASLRSYDGDIGTDRHDYVQLVLPVHGSLTLDIDGRAGRLGLARAAFVASRQWHTTIGDRPNRSVVVDIPAALVPADIADQLASSPFVPMTPAAVALVEYMRLMAEADSTKPVPVTHWAPLMLDALAGAKPRQSSRLQAMLADVDAALGRPWTAQAMASRANLSVSRLHELFREELGSTPRAWLAERRLQRVREWLARTDRPIAAIASDAGFADQSALTRAMRDTLGVTPAAYRRQQRDPGTSFP